MAIRIFTPDTFIRLEDDRVLPVMFVSAADIQRGEVIELRKLDEMQRAKVLDQYLQNKPLGLEGLFSNRIQKYISEDRSLGDAIRDASHEFSNNLIQCIAQNRGEGNFIRKHTMGDAGRDCRDFCGNNVNLDDLGVIVDFAMQAYDAESPSGFCEGLTDLVYRGVRDTLYHHINHELDFLMRIKQFGRGEYDLSANLDDVINDVLHEVEKLPIVRKRFLEACEFPITIGGRLDQFPFGLRNDALACFQSGAGIVIKYSRMTIDTLNEEIVHAIDEVLEFSYPYDSPFLQCALNEPTASILDGFRPEKMSLRDYYQEIVGEGYGLIQLQGRYAVVVEALANIVCAMDAGRIDLQYLAENVPDALDVYLDFKAKEALYVADLVEQAEQLRYG